MKKAYDLFGGAGGASLGMKEAGYDVLSFEREAVACETHEKNVGPSVQCDLSQMDWSGYDTPDLLWASPPCQPFSTAGTGTGSGDVRDGMPWFLAAVRALDPPAVIMENVLGLTFGKNRGYLTGVVQSLNELGYSVRWDVLNAADYGVPQTRRRLVLQGSRACVPPVPEPTHTWASLGAVMGWGVPDGHTEESVYKGWKHKTGTVSLQRRQTGAPPIDLLRAPAPTLTGAGYSIWSMVDTRNGNLVPLNMTPELGSVIQGFPPEWQWSGVTKRQIGLQIGNAVPPKLAEVVAVLHG